MDEVFLFLQKSVITIHLFTIILIKTEQYEEATCSHLLHFLLYIQELAQEMWR